MKVLVALALISVAYAQVQVVNLPPAPAPAYEKPDISPVLVSDEVLAAVRVQESVLRDDLRVHVADALPAPSPLRIAEPPAPAVEAVRVAAPAVDPVRVAAPRYPGKVYNDPRLRNFAL